MDTRSVDATSVASATSSTGRLPPPCEPRQPRASVGARLSPSAPQNSTIQALQREHHVAADAGHLEAQLGAALVQRAEQQRRQQHAQRVVAADQRTAMPAKPAPTT